LCVSRGWEWLGEDVASEDCKVGCGAECPIWYHSENPYQNARPLGLKGFLERNGGAGSRAPRRGP